MKRLIFALTLFATVFSFTSCSDDDDDNKEAIEYKDMPEVARNFVSEHFNPDQVLKCEKENNGFDVKFNNGVEVDFDMAGNWKKIDMNRKDLPLSVAQLLNTKYLDYISVQYPNVAIEEIERKGENIEIELVNDVEILFAPDGTVLRDSGKKGGINKPETVEPSQLPAEASTFLNTHFVGINIKKVKKEHDEFEVELTDGTEIEFTIAGKLKSVDMRDGVEVPASIMLPEIVNYIRSNSNYSGKIINEFHVLPSYFVGEYAGGFKVELSGKPEYEVYFSKTGEFIKNIID